MQQTITKIPKPNCGTIYPGCEYDYNVSIYKKKLETKLMGKNILHIWHLQVAKNMLKHR